MSASVVRLPPRHLCAIWVLPLAEAGWLVLHGSCGWLHGDRRSALEDACWLAGNTGLRRIVGLRNWGRA